MSDELLQAMWDAFQRHELTGHTDSPMAAVLDVLHKAGYRRCAEGQGTTQYCSAWEQADKACRDLTEKVIPNIRERAEKAEAEVERLRALSGDLVEKSVRVAFSHAQILAVKHFGLKFGMLPERIADTIKFVEGSKQAAALRAAIDAARGES